MTSSKRARRRRRHHHRPGQPPGAAPPRPLRLIAEGFTELSGYLQHADTAEQAAALAHQNLLDAIGALTDLMHAPDTLQIAEAVTGRNFLNDPETYTETEHEGSAAVSELVALLACSPDPTRRAPTPEDAPPDLDQLQAAAQAAIDAAGAERLFTSISSDHSAAGQRPNEPADSPQPPRADPTAP